MTSDQLKSYPNAMVMTTSNVTGKIDLAFVDRADMKVFIGLPGASAVYDILKTAVDELIRSKIISSNESPVSTQKFFKDPEKQIIQRFINAIMKGSESELEMRLIKIAKEAQGLSGRALRKIPFIAHVKFIKVKFSMKLHTGTFSLIRLDCSEERCFECQEALNYSF